MVKKLKRQFYTRPTLTVAKSLLGKYLVKNPISPGGRILVGKIVETEAYIGPKDKASHAYKWKITKRNKTEYLEGGHIYIYLCYGLYWQLNITTAGEGEPECVLIRALEPIGGYKIQNTKCPLFTHSKIQDLASGPGKLCRWLKLNKSFDGEDLTKSKRIWLAEEGEKTKKRQIVAARRIGIDYAGEWSKKPWRFYIKDNPFISRK